MRIFVTGATGFIGSAVVSELLSAGHQVLGLARSDTSAAELSAAGAEVLRGSLEHPDGLRPGAAEADAVIHAAFNHDFTRFAENCELDRRAIDAIGAELEGSRRPFLVTGVLANLADGRPATEEDTPAPPSANSPRASEAAAAALAERGVRTVVVRLPQVHDRVKQGLVSFLIQNYRDKGTCACVGDGSNRWAAAHVLDVARLYRLAIEKAKPNARYHAVAEEGVSLRAIAEAIGHRLALPVKSIAPDEAENFFDWFATFAARDITATSERTRQVLDWSPVHPGLIEDLKHGEY